MLILIIGLIILAGIAMAVEFYTTARYKKR